MLNKKTICDALELPVKINIFEEIDSTNDHLKNLTNKTGIHACLAEKQTQGKGQRQRKWHSPCGQNIMLSTLYPIKKNIRELSAISLVSAIATCRAIESCFQLPSPIMIKWPNDIMCDSKKLGGCLVETNGLHTAIIGIGLNVNMQEDPQELISQPWTSIRMLNHRCNDRNLLSAALINQLISCIKIFEAAGFEPFLNEWRARDYLRDATITFSANGRNHEGIAQGTNDKGFLILKLLDGSIETFPSGTINLHKRHSP